MVSLSLEDILHLNNVRVLVNEQEVISACEREIAKAAAIISALGGDQDAKDYIPGPMIEAMTESPAGAHYFAIGIMAGTMGVGHHLGIFDDRQVDLMQEALHQISGGDE